TPVSDRAGRRQRSAKIHVTTPDFFLVFLFFCFPTVLHGPSLSTMHQFGNAGGTKTDFFPGTEKAPTETRQGPKNDRINQPMPQAPPF
ncbi:hypothetical protein, partial [Bifidobacterium bombi]|uniref:hypothetical protein n=1 Tax=Bifidobacterium bombi TaxID=471511 RepID=UPI0005C7944F